MIAGILESLAIGRSFGNTKNEEENQMVQDVEAVTPSIGMQAELPRTKPMFDAIPSWFPQVQMPCGTASPDMGRML